MKIHVDLPVWFIPLILVLVTTVLAVGYFRSQQGRIICDPERIGFFLLKGGYRSWTLQISDGQIQDDNGKLHTVSFKRSREGQILGLRRGRKWPVYSHTDMRRWTLTDGTNILYSQPIHVRSIIKTP